MPSNALTDGDFEATAVGAVPAGWSYDNFVNFIQVSTSFVWTGAHSLHIHYSTGLFSGSGNCYWQSVSTAGATYSSAIYVNTANQGSNQTVTFGASVGSFTPITQAVTGGTAVMALNVPLSGATSQQFHINCFIGSAESAADYYIDDAWVVLHNGPMTQDQLYSLVVTPPARGFSVRDPQAFRVPGVN